MKLIKAHIANFGILENKDIEFNDLTSFYQENGKGKTTLASFIKAMFYGLPKDSKSETERKHFLPWNKGLFGGNLEFSFNNKIYKIERTFDSKSPTKDECNVYVNNIKTNEFDDKIIGEEIFKIDKETFNRTLFFDSNDLNFKDSSSSLSSKIYGHVVNFDDASFNDAISNLDKLVKEYSESKRDSNKIYSLRKINIELSNKISNYKDIENVLDSKNEKLNDFKNQKEEVKKQLEIIKFENDLKGKFDALNQYKENLKEDELSLNNIKNKYKIIPSKDEIDDIKTKNNDLKFLKKDINCEFSKENDYRRLNNEFLNGIPNNEILDSVETKIKELNKTNKKINELSYTNNSYNDLETKFKDLSSLEKNTIDQLIKEYRFKQLKSKEQNEGVNYKLFGIIFAIFSILSLIIGLIFCFAFSNKILGILIAIVGTILFGIGSCLFFLKNSKFKETNNKDDELASLLKKYGYFNSDKNVSIILFEQEFSKYQKDIENKTKIKDELNELDKTKRELQNSLYSFFSFYNIYHENYEFMLSKLKDDIFNFNKINNERISFNSQKEESNKKYEKLQDSINAFISKYEISIDLNLYLDIAKADLDLKSFYESEIKKTNEKIYKFILENKLNQSYEFHNYTSDDENNLNYKKDLLTKNIIDLENEIKEDTEKVEKIDELNSDINLNQEMIKIYEHKRYLFEKTKELLIECDSDLKNEYLAPLMNSFKKYSKLIEEDMNKNINLNSNYELQYEKDGIFHDASFLSDGMKTICALCLRLSLIDNMFKEDKPFIILDDPLLTLDENHLETSKKLIEDLSKDFQIIYFTCHECRKI